MKTFSFEDVMSIVQDRKDITYFFDESEMFFILKDLNSAFDNYTKNLFHWYKLRNDYKDIIKNKVLIASKPAQIRESLLNKFGDDQFLVYKIIRPDYIEFVVFNKYTLAVNYNNHTDNLNISCIKIYDYKDSITIKNNIKVPYKALHLAISIRTYNKEEYNEFIAELIDFEK